MKSCRHETDPKKMTLKMGGLLCPKCRTIIYQPYVDKEYDKELKRRRALSK